MGHKESNQTNKLHYVMDCDISELRYKEKNLQRSYRKMKISNFNVREVNHSTETLCILLISKTMILIENLICSIKVVLISDTVCMRKLL